MPEITLEGEVAPEHKTLLQLQLGAIQLGVSLESFNLKVIDSAASTLYHIKNAIIYTKNS